MNEVFDTFPKGPNLYPKGNPFVERHGVLQVSPFIYFLSFFSYYKGSSVAQVGLPTHHLAKGDPEFLSLAVYAVLGVIHTQDFKHAR